ncbi:hypothetical protein WR25_06365 [Diploscapter pachys]|uniref:Las1-like protein n=1 Tax=Diploscapter pachys TaxID=2018661 RepID=A0A2A2KM41_9BILA|nr:hypothetical protein WR25_06365 [Diploscapter pachys]
MGQSENGGELLGDTVMEVPFTMLEWNVAREKFMSNEPKDMQFLLDMFVMWKTRMTLRVPIAIACSEVILRAALHDARIRVEMDRVNRDAGDGQSLACVDQCGANSSGSSMGELTYVIDNFEETKCLFGHAIIRFISYIVDIGCAEDRRLSTKQAVRKHGIPEWIVDVRNSCTHEHTPSISQLREAVKFIREWLNKKWWNRQYTHSLDNLIGSNAGETPREKRERRICETIQKFTEISMARFQGQLASREDHELSAKLFEDMTNFVMINSKTFLRCLVSEGCLIFPEGSMHILTQIPSNDGYLMIPIEIQLVWRSVFTLIIKNELVGSFLIILLNRMNENKDKPHLFAQYRSWSRLLLEASVDPKLEYFITQSEWRQILKEALVVGAHFPKNVFDGIISRIDNISNSTRSDVNQFVNISTKTMEEASDPSEDDYTVKSVEDLQKALRKDHSNSSFMAGSSNERKNKLFKKCSRDVWQKTPSGLCPSQVLEGFWLYVEDEPNPPKGKRAAPSNGGMNGSMNGNEFNAKRRFVVPKTFNSMGW